MYDKVGNLKSYDDGTTTGLYDYDANYRKILETINYGTFELSNSYTYYKNGMKKTFTGPDTITYTYGYDDNNQVAVVQIPGVGLISYDEYSWNRPVGMAYPGGTTKEFAYDPFMRIESITVKGPMQTVLMDYEYSYDKADNIIGKSTEHGDYVYGYDDLYRLTTVDNPILDDEAFTYDGVGNRIASADVPGDWTYNQNNELEAYNGISLHYDANGSTTGKLVNGQPVNSYVYNAENRLARVEDGGGSTIAEYYYDPFGRRLLKDVGGTKTYFFYADEGLVGEYNGAGTEIKTYGYRPNSTWTTDPLFIKQNSNYYFYHNDHLGTPQKITDINGNVVWSAKHESFGEATVEVETVVNNLRFPGQYYDGETGLHYNWHRYYDSGAGRYVRPDPLGQLRNVGSAEEVIIRYLIEAFTSREGSNRTLAKDETMVLFNIRRGDINPIWKVCSLFRSWDGALRKEEYIIPYIYGLNNPLKYIDHAGLYSWCKFKCDFRKFSELYYCNVTRSNDHLACRDELVVFQDCIREADRRYRDCVKLATDGHEACIKKCECEEDQ